MLNKKIDIKYLCYLQNTLIWNFLLWFCVMAYYFVVVLVYCKDD